MRDKNFRNAGPEIRAAIGQCRVGFPRYLQAGAAFLPLLILVVGLAAPTHARGKKDALPYGEGLIVNVPFPEAEVSPAVEDVAQNTIVRGTKEYNKDEYLTGAIAATSTPFFPQWTEGGKVFYKVRKDALDPRNFKDGGDLGTLAVRYVVQPQGDKNTVLRIDAVFVDNTRHSIHQSNGSVEGSEYRAIHDRLEQASLVRKETEEAIRSKQKRAANEDSASSRDTVVLSTPPPETSRASTNAERDPQPATSQPPATYEQPGESVEQRIAELRRQVERLVKKPGAPLKSAPFHTSSTLTSLAPGVEVLIQISTPYWYGVETRDGQHGWVQRDQLEFLP